MHIVMGGDGSYSSNDIDTFTFQRDFVSPLKLKNAMYVQELKKNLVSIAVLEYHGYDVKFNKRKAFLRHITMGQVKKIKAQVRRLYKLDVEDCATVSTKSEKV